LVESTEVHRNHKRLMSTLLAPEILYLDSTLSDDQIRQGLDIFLCKDVPPIPKQEIQDVFAKIVERLLSSKPPIMLMMTTEYSADKFPGFLSFPHIFVPEDLKEFIRENAVIVEENRQRYEKNYSACQDLLTILNKEYGIKQVIRDDSEGSDRYLFNFKIFLLQIKKYFAKRQIVSPVATIRMTKTIDFSDGELHLPHVFKDWQLDKFLSS